METGLFVFFSSSLAVLFAACRFLFQFELYFCVATVLLGAAAVLSYAVYPLLLMRHIPGPSASLFSGHLGEATDQGVHLFLLEQSRKYGKMYRIVFGRNPTVVISDPELTKQVFVDQFKKNFHSRPTQGIGLFGATKHLFVQQGADWRSSRRALQPSFNTHNLAHFATDMNKAGIDFVNRLRTLKTGEDINIWRWFGQLTMQVISSTSFGAAVAQTDPSGNPLIQACATVLNEAQPSNNAAIYYLQLFPFIITLLTKFSKLPNLNEKIARTKRAMETIANKTDEMADKLRQGTEDNEAVKRSFLNLLLHAKDKDTGKELDVQEVRDQSFLFILAGYETTANTLAYATYLLAANPDKLEKVLEEVDRLTPNGKDVQYSDMKNFVYLDFVIQETLRLYPPAPVLIRKAFNDTVIGGYAIPKGSNIMVANYSIHRDEKIYASPDEFIPERWDPTCDEAVKRHKFAWLPFGEGPRKCIGYRFALEEMKIVIARVFKEYTFELSPRCSHPLKTRMGATLSPKDGIFVNAIPRHA